VFPRKESHCRGATTCLGTGKALTPHCLLSGIFTHLSSWSHVDDGIKSPREAQTSANTRARWWHERRHGFGTQSFPETLGLGNLRARKEASRDRACAPGAPIGAGNSVSDTRSGLDCSCGGRGSQNPREELPGWHARNHLGPDLTTGLRRLRPKGPANRPENGRWEDET
jgi:hypothetical protein